MRGEIAAGVRRFDLYPALVRYFGAFWCLVNLSMAAVFARPGHLELMLTPVWFLAIGVAGTFGRYQLDLIDEPGVVEIRVGWGPWSRRWRRYEAGTFHWVALRLTATRGDNSTTLHYSVILVGPTVERTVQQQSDLLKARATAESVANSLGLGVSDELTQTGYREPGTLDEPLKQRLARVSLPPLGPPPPGLDVQVWGDELRAKLPRAKPLPQLSLALCWLGMGAIGALPLVVLLAGFGHPSVTREPVLSAVLSGLGMPLMLIAAVVTVRELATLERDVTMRVSPRGLYAELEGRYGARTLSLAAQQLETVGVGHRARLGSFPRLGPARIVACADRELIAFGAGCSPDQHAWLIRAIHCYLRGPGA